ncbi:MAG: glycosyltransferase family 2 protein [Firmicutes bacterium]|nr:glycosyltransferase family 2 protein [Bacillota bacterium]
MDRLAIVVPCYNEEEVLKIASKALRDVLEDLSRKGKISEDSFILFVDDGSKDRTWELIEEEHKAYPDKVRGVKLAGNVGHQFALTAGLVTAKDMCDVTVSIDADLQDDVDVIEEMLDKFHVGCDIVYGVRRERKTDTFFKRTTAQMFYKLMSLMGVKTVYNHADFRLMSRRAVEEFSKYKETNLFLRGMMPLIGYQTDSVYYDRKERVAGESKYPLKKMLALAFNGISSFSVKPISLIMGLGLFIILMSALALVYALISYCTGHVVPGWTSLILSIWFLGGLQLLAIGMVGQYIGKIYIEVKHRPRYNIEKILTSGEASTKGEKMISDEIFASGEK